MIPPLAARFAADPACMDELLAVLQANWTGERTESVFRLRALLELSSLSTEALVALAAEHALVLRQAQDEGD